MGFSNPIVGGEDLIRSGIRSPNYVAGSAGWRIAQDGSAEFNNVLIRGTLRTAAPPNKRIEIGTTQVNRIDFYSGDANEVGQSYIQSTYALNRAFLELVSGATAGDGQAYVELNSAPTPGGLANFTVSFTGNNVALDRAGDFHCFLGAAGIARFYCTAERLLVDDFGILVTGTIDATQAVNATGNVTAGADVFAGGSHWANHNAGGFYARGYGDTNHGFSVPPVAPTWGTNFNVDGPVFRGWNNWILATATNAHWQMAIGANYVQVFGGLGVSSGSNNDINIDPEAITTVGGTSGISMRQRSRATWDAVKRMVIYAEGDNLRIWQDGLSGIFSIGNTLGPINSFSTMCVAVPALGGGNTMNLQVAGSWQVGYISSRRAHKLNVRKLGAGAENPVFKLEASRFNWNAEHVADADEINARHPDGVAGLMAEDVAQWAPDAAIYAGNSHAHCPPGCEESHPGDDIPEGTPIGVNVDRLLAYLVDAVQHLNRKAKP